MSAQKAARTNGSAGPLAHHDAVLLTAPTNPAGQVTSAQPVHAVDLQETIDRLTGSISDVLAERDALRSEVAALQAELTTAEAALAESSRNADIVARITGLVQQMGASGPTPVAQSSSDEAAAEADSLPDDADVPAFGGAPLSFLELRDILTADAGISVSVGELPDSSQLNWPKPLEAMEAKAAQPKREPLARETSRKLPSFGRWPARILAWASIGVVAFAVAAVLAITAGPRVLPYQTFYVFGRSMEPTIPLGSMVVLQPITFDQIEVGDVITVERPDAPGALVTHRVIGIEDTPQGLGLVTQGDANTTPDPWRVSASGEGYRLRFSIPYLGYLLYAFHAPIGRLGLVIVPAIALGGLLMMQLWRPRRARQVGLVAAC